MALILIFHNDGTGDRIVGPFNGVGNYSVSVLVGDGGPNSTIISNGRVEGHQRDLGWQALVGKYLDEHPG